ncbi:hypothetical protein TNCV_4785861 [Trichonephila clavipes]|nr:hypothetical protein TNCV_4785861 [Trichonephila clavipes]
MHPSVYAEIKKLGHAKSDVLLSENGSSLSADSGVVSVSNSPLVSMKKEKRKTYRCGQRTVRLAGCGMQPKPSSLRAQAQLSETRTVTETYKN